MTEDLGIQRLELDEIAPHPQNDYSMVPKELDELARSIETVGLSQLPLVRLLPDGTHQMLCGHRRLLAFKRLRAAHPGDERWETIPCSIVSGISDEMALARLNASNLITREMSPAERASRIAQIFGAAKEEGPRRDSEGKPMSTAERAADIITEQTGKPISVRTVYRALKQDQMRRDAEAEAVRRTGQLDHNWEVEAGSGRVDAETIKRISELPPKRQEALFVDYQRDSMSPTKLRRAVVGAEPPSYKEGMRAMDQAITCVRRAARVAEGHVPIARAQLARLREALAELERAMDAQES